MPISKNGIPLRSLTEWEMYAGPKRSNQWVDGRSAKEVARAWLEGRGVTVPTEVSLALATHKAFGTVQAWAAESESKLYSTTSLANPATLILSSSVMLGIGDHATVYTMARTRIDPWELPLIAERTPYIPIDAHAVM